MTDHRTDDRAWGSSLLNQGGINYIEELLADGGYDSHGIYHSLKAQSIKPLIPPLINVIISSVVDPTLKDQTIDYIQKKGYWAWYNKNNFGRRNKVENAFYRLKTIAWRKLLSRSLLNQNAETHLICCLLNKMTDLGMPWSIKIA
ncbi:MAG: hypothetical protein BGO67_04750 [Alphaproteobacteria bacterium 41-28]|nr:MAG: hypothetical protein BGO67_04750 [Alphaproteobacteria bacterium 41-28]